MSRLFRKPFSRRDFIKITGAAAAVGVGVSGCASGKKAQPDAKKINPQPITRTSPANRGGVDVVVIGTGMGGSAAGAIAAHNGLKTLILEKNPRPGGSCSYYEKQGFHMDTGAHMFIQGNNGPFGHLTKRLGMGTPINFVKARNTLDVRGINLNFTIPGNMFLRGMALPAIAWQTKIKPSHYFSIANLFRKIVFMSESDIEKLDNVTIDEFMTNYTDSPEVRTMLAGFIGMMTIVPPWEASAGESIWNTKKLLKGMSLSYPEGGSVTIPKTFLSGAEQNGAEIHMNTGVKKIEIKEGKVTAVILDNGQKVRTRAVISTTSVKDTVFRLTGEAYFPVDYINHIKTITPSFTAIQAKLALKKEVVDAGCLMGGIPIKSENNIVGEFLRVAYSNAVEGLQGDYIPIYAPIPTSFDPKLAPPGCQIITAAALAPTLDVKLKGGTESWINGMMNALHQMIPDLEENLIFYDTWSTKALASWIGKCDGSVISTGQTVNQVHKSRPAHKTAIKGLYLAGDCAGPARGVGTELACQSGMDCADLVTADIKNAQI